MVAHIFTKLSQNVFLVNKNILTYWHARCDGKLWNTIWFYCVYWVFLTTIHIWNIISLYKTFTYYVSNQDWYVKMSDVTTSYGISPKFSTFFANFAQNWWIFMSEVLYLHQTFINCVFDMNNEYKYLVITSLLSRPKTALKENR